MLIYVFSEELCWCSGLHCITPYWLYVFSLVLLITSGGWVKVTTLLYCVTLVYDMIKLLVVTLIWCLSSAFPSPLYFGNQLLEISYSVLQGVIVKIHEELPLFKFFPYHAHFTEALEEFLSFHRSSWSGGFFCLLLKYRKRSPIRPLPLQQRS